MKTRKTKSVAVEVIPSPTRILQATVDEVTLQKLVQQKVAEILTARDEFVFEPFFRSRQVAFEVRRLQTVPELKKWSIHYERHGCLHCAKSERPHGACGMCGPCSARVARELRLIVRELMGEPAPAPASPVTPRERPRVVNYDRSAKIASLRAQGRTWRDICKETGLSQATAQRAFYAVKKREHSE